jgi:hypothetical protein
VPVRTPREFLPGAEGSKTPRETPTRIVFQADFDGALAAAEIAGSWARKATSRREAKIAILECLLTEATVISVPRT